MVLHHLCYSYELKSRLQPTEVYARSCARKPLVLHRSFSLLNQKSFPVFKKTANQLQTLKNYICIKNCSENQTEVQFKNVKTIKSYYTYHLCTVKMIMNSSCNTHRKVNAISYFQTVLH